MVRFCDKCGSVLLPKTVNGKKVLKCECGNIEPLNDDLHSIYTKKEKLEHSYRDELISYSQIEDWKKSKKHENNYKQIGTKSKTTNDFKKGKKGFNISSKNFSKNSKSQKKGDKNKDINLSLKRDKKTNRYKCLCGKTFRYSKDLFNHIFECKSFLFKKDEKGIYYCNCGDYFFKPISLFYHYQSNPQCLKNLFEWKEQQQNGYLSQNKTSLEKDKKSKRKILYQKIHSINESRTTKKQKTKAEKKREIKNSKKTTDKIIWLCPKESCNNREIEILKTKSGNIRTKTYRDIIIHFLQHLKLNNPYFSSRDLYKIFTQYLNQNIDDIAKSVSYEGDASHYKWQTNLRSVLDRIIKNKKHYIDTEEYSKIPSYVNNNINDKRKYRTRKRTDKFFNKFTIFDDWELYNAERNEIEIKIPKPDNNMIEKSIKDFIGEIYDIVDVIDGTSLNDEMVNNILQIYFTDDLENELFNLLDDYNKIFDENRESIQQLKPGRLITGPYSSGKSHFALFVAFLLGLEFSFSDPEQNKKIPDIRVKCWNILESKFGESKIKNYKNLRKGKFLTSFISLTDYLENSDLFSIIIKSLNKTIKEKSYDFQIGLRINKKNTEVILTYIRENYPNTYKKYIKAEKEKQKIKILKNVMDNHDLQFKIKSTNEIALDLREFLEKNDYDGCIIFLDEFYRYYDIKNENNKKKIGGVLQNLSYEIQNSIKMGLLPISQIPLLENDVHFEQVARRFKIVNISYRNAKKVIFQRLIPEINQKKLKNFYNNEFIFQDVPEKRKKIKKEDFVMFYPFHIKTFNDLENMVGYYVNDTKGIINYARTTLYKYSNKKADNLITADTLYDYFISDRDPKQEGYELKEKYLDINENYINNINSEIEKRLTKKILKIILFCTNQSRVWDRQDFYLHFYYFKNEIIDKVLDNLLNFVNNHSNFISTDINKYKFYYNPGGKGDISRYTSIIEKSTNRKQLINYFWNKQKSKEFELTPQNYVLGEYNYRKIFKKSYILCTGLDHIESAIRRFDSVLEPEDIFNYQFNRDLVFEALFIIGSISEQDKQLIEKKINNIQFHNIHESNNKYVFYFKPARIKENEIEKIINYYGRLILLDIFNLIKSNNISLNWDQIRDFLIQKNYMNLIDQTILRKNIIHFKNIKKDIINDFIRELDLSLKEDNLNNENIITKRNIQILFREKLNDSEIYNQNEWDEIVNDYNKEIENRMEEVIFDKYPILHHLMQDGSKKLYGNYLTRLFNDFLEYVFIDNKIEFTAQESTVREFSNKILSKLQLVVKGKEIHSYFFNENINLENSKYLNEISKLQKEFEEIPFREIIYEYMKEPYGFPKVITVFIIFSLIQMQKFILKYEDQELTSISQILKTLSGKSNKSKLNNIITKSKVSKGDVIEKNQLTIILKILKLLISHENLIEIPNNDQFQSLSQKLYENSIISVNEQNQLIEFIRNIELKFKVGQCNEFLENVFEDFNNFLSLISDDKEKELNLTCEIKEFNSLRKFSEFFKQIQEFTNSGKSFLVHFSERFSDNFIGDSNINYFNELERELVQISKIKDLSSNNDNDDYNFKKFNDYKKLFFDIYKRSNKFSKKNTIIRKNLKEELTDILKQNKLYEFLLETTDFSKTRLFKLTKKFVDTFQNEYRITHNRFWEILSDIKNEIFKESNGIYQDEKLVFLNLISNTIPNISIDLEKEKERFSICTEKIDASINLNECSKCDLSLQSSFKINFIFNNKIKISEIKPDLEKEKVENRDQIRNQISSEYIDIVHSKILDIIERFRFSKDIGSKIKENLLFNELSKESREEINKNNYLKSLENLDYSKIEEVFKKYLKKENLNNNLNMLDLLLRISLILKNQKNYTFFLNQLKQIVKILGEEEFGDYLNKIIRKQLTPLEKLKINYGIKQFKDIFSINLKENINREIKNRLKKGLNEKYNNYKEKLIIPKEKDGIIKNIKKKLEDLNISSGLIYLKNNNKNSLNIFKSENRKLKNKNNIFFERDFIDLDYNEDINFEKTSFEILLLDIFSDVHCIGKIDEIIKSISTIFVKNIFIWKKKGNNLNLFAILSNHFGFIEENKIKRNEKND